MPTVQAAPGGCGRLRVWKVLADPGGPRAPGRSASSCRAEWVRSQIWRHVRRILIEYAATSLRQWGRSVFSHPRQRRSILLMAYRQHAARGRVGSRSRQNRQSSTSYAPQRSLLIILAYFPTTVSSVQFCLLCCQPGPIPGSSTAGMQLPAQQHPCRLLAWLG